MSEKTDVQTTSIEERFGYCRVRAVVLEVEERKPGQYSGKYGVGHQTYEFYQRMPVRVGEVVEGDAIFSVSYGRVQVAVYPK